MTVRTALSLLSLHEQNCEDHHVCLLFMQVCELCHAGLSVEYLRTTAVIAVCCWITRNYSMSYVSCNVNSEVPTFDDVLFCGMMEFTAAGQIRSRTRSKTADAHSEQHRLQLSPMLHHSTRRRVKIIQHKTHTKHK